MLTKEKEKGGVPKNVILNKVPCFFSGSVLALWSGVMEGAQTWGGGGGGREISHLFCSGLEFQL